jgi:hypothetical protein
MENLLSVFSLLVSSSSQHSTLHHPSHKPSHHHYNIRHPPTMSNDLRRTSTSQTAVHPGQGVVMNDKNRPMQTLIDNVDDQENGYRTSSVASVCCRWPALPTSPP